MRNSELAVVGERATVVALGGLGISAFPVETVGEARATVQRLLRAREHAVVFITEDVGEALSDLIAESAKAELPSVVLVPSSAGSRKIGLKKLARVLKSALGADILNVD